MGRVSVPLPHPQDLIGREGVKGGGGPGLSLVTGGRIHMASSAAGVEVGLSRTSVGAGLSAAGLGRICPN